MAEHIRREKLPIWPTVAEAFAVTWANAGYLARISWAWVLVMLPVVFAFRWAEHRHGWDNQASGNPMALVAMLADVFLLAPMLASIAVAWHRKLLTGEEWPSRLYLRFDGVVRRYVLFGAVITLWLVATIWLFALLDALNVAPSVEPNSTAAFTGLGVMLVALYVATRQWLALPGVALERDGASLALSWRITRGNIVRILLACLLCMLPSMLYFGTFRRLVMVDGPTSLLTKVVHATAHDFLATFLLGMPLLSLLSLAYRHLSMHREDVTAHASA